MSPSSQPRRIVPIPVPPEPEPAPPLPRDVGRSVLPALADAPPERPLEPIKETVGSFLTAS